MNEPATAPGNSDRQTALFAGLVFQMTEMGLTLLGHGSNSAETAKEPDVEHARVVIEQLEMIEAKTKGNLTPAEAGMLKQSLAMVRMAFVEAVNQSNRKGTTETAASMPGPETKSAPAPEGVPGQPEDSVEDSKVRFSKKY